MNEPIIKVGLLEHASVVRGTFEGKFEVNNEFTLEGSYEVRNDHGLAVIIDRMGKPYARGNEIRCRAESGSRCRIHDMMIGQKFHWERREDQVFDGNFLFLNQPDGTLIVINEIPLEQYLASVISSEMSSSAPSEFLQAHAVISRSWLVAVIEKGRSMTGPAALCTIQKEGEITRWYGREDHLDYDVCANDHCQRYHGLGHIRSESVLAAVQKTRGKFLVYDGKICDARYSKSCGGWTENFENTWEDIPVPYLVSVNDSSLNRIPLKTEKESTQWILSTPEAYCHTNDESILRNILPSFDQETKDFYRWRVGYEREELENILLEKSGIDFGTVMDIMPIRRGSSGRIIQLRICGTKHTIIVGKELEIRRWLSKTHLKSSAFAVEIVHGAKNIPQRFIFHGAGWGHGVGLCQIGAAVMAMHGVNAEKILQHYYLGAAIRKLY
ncbi:MAG: SpoIID/LytB domain-containing protein [Bacteroidota bacterium]